MKEYLLCIILGILLYFIIQDNINKFSIGIPYQIWSRRYNYNEDLSIPEYRIFNTNTYRTYNEQTGLLDDVMRLPDNIDNLNFYVQEVYEDGIPVFRIGRGNRGVTGNYGGDYYNVLLPARVYTENQNIRNIFDEEEDEDGIIDSQPYPELRLNGELYYILNPYLNRDDYGMPLANAYLWQQFWIDLLTRHNIPNPGDNILLYNLNTGTRVIVEEPEDIAPAPGIAQLQPRPQQTPLTRWQRFLNTCGAVFTRN